MKLTDGFRTQSSDGRTSQQSLVSKKVVHACINAPTASVLYTVTRQLNLRSLGVSTRITPTLTHTMTEGKVILVTGGTGLVGRAVQYVEQGPRLAERLSITACLPQHCKQIMATLVPLQVKARSPFAVAVTSRCAARVGTWGRTVCHASTCWTFKCRYAGCPSQLLLWWRAMQWVAATSCTWCVTSR